MSSPAANCAWATPQVRVEPPWLAPGEPGHLVVTLEIPDGCHIQSHTPSEPFLVPTTVHLDGTDDLELGPVSYPAGHTETFDWTPVTLDVYLGTLEIIVPVDIRPGAGGGTASISGHVRYQGCTESACLPPIEHRIAATAAIASDTDRHRRVSDAT